MDISLHDLVLRHPGQADDLLRVTDRTVSAGSSVVIRGASGCGKTTLLHVIAGLLAPAAGHVRLGSHDLATLGSGARARLRRAHIGIVFQRLNLLDHLTALENVRLGKPGVTPETAREALACMDLAALADRPGEVLSLGEQQRVAVARVLAARPAIILADEPTSALDDANAERVLTALKGEAERGATVVVVTHDHRVDDHFGALWPIEDGALR